MARRVSTATEEKRNRVKLLAGYGFNEERIAAMLGLKSASTLRKYYCKELETGPAEANAKVATALYKMATSGKDVAATIFYVKTQMGWREDAQKPKAPIEVQVRFVTPPGQAPPGKVIPITPGPVPLKKLGSGEAS